MYQSLDLRKKYYFVLLLVQNTSLYVQMKSASHTTTITALKFTCCSSLSQLSTWALEMAVMERVAERLLRSSFVDLGTGTLESSKYLLYFLKCYPSSIKLRVKHDL